MFSEPLKRISIFLTAGMRAPATLLIVALLASCGVVVPAGRHVVRFVYRPVSIIIGATVSALALITIGVLLYLKAIAPN